MRRNVCFPSVLRAPCCLLLGVDSLLSNIVQELGSFEDNTIEVSLKSFEDFKRPEVKEAYDSNGNGLAEMVACPPGWGCEIAIQHHFKEYGHLKNEVYWTAMSGAIDTFR